MQLSEHVLLFIIIVISSPLRGNKSQTDVNLRNIIYHVCEQAEQFKAHCLCIIWSEGNIVVLIYHMNLLVQKYLIFNVVPWDVN